MAVVAVVWVLATLFGAVTARTARRAGSDVAVAERLWLRSTLGYLAGGVCCMVLATWVVAEAIGHG
jgi:hypothetical protein